MSISEKIARELLADRLVEPFASACLAGELEVVPTAIAIRAVLTALADMDKAVAGERERAAKVAEEVEGEIAGVQALHELSGHDGREADLVRNTAKHIAERIRSTAPASGGGE